MTSWLRSPTLQATGSVARDHLALERTLLAWLRTGLGFIALGIAVERFSQLEGYQPTPAPSDQHVSKRKILDAQNEHILVATLLGAGTGSIAYGSVRYFSTMKLLQRNLYRPAYFGAAALGIGVAGLAGAAVLSNSTETFRYNDSKR
jgi:uncharacterized membrane protein YidH (DUF202 family)